MHTLEQEAYPKRPTATRKWCMHVRILLCHQKHAMVPHCTKESESIGYDGHSASLACVRYMPFQSDSREPTESSFTTFHFHPHSWSKADNKQHGPCSAQGYTALCYKRESQPCLTLALPWYTCKLPQSALMFITLQALACKNSLVCCHLLHHNFLVTFTTT